MAAVAFAVVATHDIQGRAQPPLEADTQSACPAGWICPTTPIFTSQVGIWYSVWFDGVTPGANCSANPQPRWCRSRYKPVRGYYNSGNPLIIDQHLAELKSAGVDFLILDYTNGIIPSPDNLIFTNGQAFIARENALHAQSKSVPFSMAIGAGLWASCCPATQNNEADAVYNSYYLTNPGTYFKRDNKPLLINYNSYGDENVCSPNWTDTRFTVGLATAHLSTGRAGQMQYGSTWWGWVSEFPQPLSADAMTITPGADSLHAGSGSGYDYHIDRSGGADLGCGGCGTGWSAALVADPIDGLLFEHEWLRAIKKNPRTIVIGSYNEFIDENAIEPAYARTDFGQAVPKWKDRYGAETPDLYLQIATAYAHLRTGLMNGVYYQDEDSLDLYQVVNGALIHQGQYPHAHPVILLPAGTLKRLLPATSPITPPANGTMMTSPGLPPALVVGGAQLWFDTFATLQKFAATTLPVDNAFYTGVPFAGVIHGGGPVFGTPGYPPVFESSVGELWTTDCLDAITANGSSIQTILGPLYSSYVFRGTLHCI